jgi:Leucine-rich repeat (LRR) protein
MYLLSNRIKKIENLENKNELEELELGSNKIKIIENLNCFPKL